MSEYSPIRRLSTSSSNSYSRQEELINAYEAEEERIINTLSRKLEKLREEKIELENALEAESESHVNRLNKEIYMLRRQQAQTQANGTNGTTESSSTSNGVGSSHSYGPTAPPNAEFMLDAMMKENEQLRARLASTERDYIRISRLNEIYREELIEHRRRCGIPVDNLIGLTAEPYSQPTHRRSASSISSTSSPPTGINYQQPPPPPRAPKHGVPIPRANTPSQANHRPSGLDVGIGGPRGPITSITSSMLTSPSSESTTPFSSSYSGDSPYAFSPINNHSTLGSQSTSLVSNATHMTTPPSSSSAASFNFADHYPLIQNGINGGDATLPPAARTIGLTYPSVPPPSLSSSPNVPYHLYTSAFNSNNRDPSLSPVEATSRRNSNSNPNARRGSFTADWRSLSRRSSVERGARIAESGTLLPRSRGQSRSRGDSYSQGVGVSTQGGVMTQHVQGRIDSAKELGTQEVVEEEALGEGELREENRE